MDFFSVLALLGGLAIFLYGMNLMGDGLAKVAGGKLERILETLTSNPIRAVLLGMGVTAVIQSSSATTVMVVGFVNSGIMKLSQVVGIIMGANIGTTVTSWILSLTGIQSDNFIIRLFKPTSFSPILALIGVVLIMFTKSQKKKDVGAIFVGFAILMYGMNAMSGAVEPLAEVPEFTGMLVKFYQLINKISDADIVDGARDFRLMKRSMVDAIVSMSEYNRFSKGIFGWIGFRTCWLPYKNIERVAGETKWNFWKLFKYAVSGIINFSQVPLTIASWFGTTMTGFSFLVLVAIIVRKLIFDDPVPGWASTICVIIFIGGLQLFCLGIMGQYIAKTYMEVKQRPHYIIAESNKKDFTPIR